jgi:hypothetical protein
MGRIGGVEAICPLVIIPLMPKSVLLVFSLAVAILGAGCQKGPVSPPASAAIDHTKYYAVLLSNGAVYFGRLDGLGSDFPVLTDVYYIQTTVDQESKKQNNTLIKRGKELHAPDRMILNARSIVFVEPVGTDSRVAQLISESKK